VSDTNELDRMRADLEVLKRYNEAGEGVLDRAVAIASDRIIRLKADPTWRFARDTVGFMERGSGVSAEYQIGVARYVRHLEAELESAKNCEIDENGRFVRDLSESEANPWAEAKDWVDSEYNHLGGGPSPVARYVRHIEAENAALREEVRLSHIERDEHAAAVKARDRGIEQQKAQIAQLESGEKSDSLVIRGLRMKIAELEAQPVPPLDPKRVYATWIQTQGHRAAWADAEPYPVAWDKET